MIEREVFRQLLLAHVARYPRSEPQDVYKLVFQGCCGPEHALADPGAALQRLRDEITTAAEVELEPVIEPLPPEGRFVRVHLRPYVAGGGDLAVLAGAFVRSAVPVVDGRERLAAAWSRVVDLAGEELLAFDAAAARAFSEVQRAAGFPAVRHSASYTASYAPMYRVVAAAEAVRLWPLRG